MANNLYYSDAIKGTIEVFSLTKKRRAIVHHYTGNYKPNAIVLVPTIGEMFVALTSREHSLIDRHSIKGEMFDDSNHHVIETGLSNSGPFHMVVDEQAKKLYWSDTGNRRIEFSNFDGSERKLFINNERAPAALALIGDELHWTSKRSESLRWRNKSGKGQIKAAKMTIPKGLNEADTPEIISIVAGVPLKISNHPCTINNGGCSDICISDGSSARVCECQTGRVFKDNLNMICLNRTVCDFRCKSGECLEAAKKCDGHVDCTDKSDEDKAICKKDECSFEQFQCTNGQCILNKQRCDKHFDCKDQSDEKNCPTDQETVALCKKDQFHCPLDNLCIYETQICDGIKDCSDGSDETEKMCNRKCNDEFKCKSGQCIPKEFECNSIIECGDGSDEHEKCQFKICSAPKKPCRNGHCLHERFFCDGHFDCSDGFDELHCEETSADNTCQIGEFQCRSQPEVCLPQSKHCDNKNDCKNGEDEKGCSCPLHMFECNNAECIFKHQKCDGRYDCKDHSDESDCGDKDLNTRIAAITCTKNSFKCSDGTCLDYENVCDGTQDCDDDEGPACKTSCQTDKVCDQICRKTPKGSKCECREGYELKSRGEVKCVDVDECTLNPCSQECKNIDGSFRCFCFEGYTLIGKTECRARGKAQQLFYILNNHVRMITQSSTMDMDVIFEADIPLSDIAVDAAKQMMLLSMTQVRGMIAVDIVTKKVIETYQNFPPAHRFAYDWITENVYIAHRENNFLQIDLCNLRSQKCVIVQKSTYFGENIASIDIDPLKNYVFFAKSTFSFYTKFVSEIIRMRLDGTDRKVIFSESTHNLIKSLAVDVNKQLVYFAESNTQSLQAIDYDGGNVKTFAHQSRMLRQPADMSLFEDHAYVLDEVNSRISRCKLYDDNKCNTLDLNTASSVRFIISHQIKQKDRQNYCANHACGEICINADTGSKCLCSKHNETLAVECKEVVS